VLLAGVVSADLLPDLLGALEAQVGAAEHEQRGQAHGRNWDSMMAGRMNSSLLRSDPMAIFLMIGSSRSGVKPWT
jgi:hypothetical protein